MILEIQLVTMLRFIATEKRDLFKAEINSRNISSVACCDKNSFIQPSFFSFSIEIAFS